MAETDDLDWQIAVFGQNEAARIGACITSIAKAATGLRVLVTLILNGCTDNSAKLALEAAKAADLPLEIYTIEHADKSNAINRFFYDLGEDPRVIIVASMVMYSSAKTRFLLYRGAWKKGQKPTLRLVLRLTAGRCRKARSNR